MEEGEDESKSAGGKSIQEITTRLSEGAKFSGTEELTMLLRKIALSNNKSVEQTYSGGTMVKWSCKPWQARCSWHVWMTKKRKPTSTKTRKSKYSHIPVDQWYISRVCLDHNELCMSAATPSVNDLLEMVGFNSAFVEGHSTALARVSKALKEIDKINMDGRQATLYRAIRKRLMQTNIGDDYSLLPVFFTAFESRNPGSRVSCQLDAEGRFFRLFLSVGPLVAHHSLLLPVLQTDGTHMKGDNYNGICLTMIGLDGDRKVVPLAVAFVPSETNDNFSWFFANCIVSGISLANLPLFSDRGKQRGAQKYLSSLGYQVNLKFCAWHIVLNIKDHFRSVESSIDEIEPLVYRLQKCDTVAEYESTLLLIDKTFPAPRNIHRPGGTIEFQTAGEYLRKIHPTSWARLGNYDSNEAERSYIDKCWSQTDSYGKSVPLYGVRTTSAVEANNKGLLWSGVRDNEVLMGTILFCRRAAATLTTKHESLKLWTDHKCNVTPTAKKYFDKELLRSSSCSVRPINYSDSEFYVDDPITNKVGIEDGVISKIARTHVVKLAIRKCARCNKREHLQLPCRHLLAALRKSKNATGVSALALVNSCYTVRAYEASFKETKIYIPLLSEIIPSQVVQPPLKYKTGASNKRSSSFADRAKRQKRAPNRGEQPRSSQATSATDNVGLRVSPGSEVDEDVVAAMQEQIVGLTPSSRGPYHCTAYRVADGYNIATCVKASNENIETQAASEVNPGGYVVGNCPFIELSHQQVLPISNFAGDEI